MLSLDGDVGRNDSSDYRSRGSARSTLAAIYEALSTGQCPVRRSFPLAKKTALKPSGWIKSKRGDRRRLLREGESREPSEVTPIAVTKYAAPEQIREIIQLGICDLGEKAVCSISSSARAADQRIFRPPGWSWLHHAAQTPLAYDRASSAE